MLAHGLRAQSVTDKNSPKIFSDMRPVRSFGCTSDVQDVSHVNSVNIHITRCVFMYSMKIRNKKRLLYVSRKLTRCQLSPAGLPIPLLIISAVEDHVNMPFLWVLLSWLLGTSIYRRAGMIRIYWLI